MKELKHLIYFESLLEDTNNELVRKAESEGDLALGYTCFHAPEVLMNLGNCFSVRLRAPHTNSMELATYYMANNSCEFARALLERALEGNYAFLHAMIGVDVCEANNRAIENMEIMHMQGEDKDKFFYCNLDIPYSDDEDCVEHIREQVSRKILKPLRENYGIDTSDDAIRAAVSEHNEVCRILTEIGELRKLDIPPITGYEYAVLVLVSYTCPKRLILPYLRETLEEIKSRKTDAEKDFRVRVVVVGIRPVGAELHLLAHGGADRRTGGRRPLLLRLLPRQTGNYPLRHRGRTHAGLPLVSAAHRVPASERNAPRQVPQRPCRTARQGL